jgi:hypothetical protein
LALSIAARRFDQNPRDLIGTRTPPPLERSRPLRRYGAPIDDAGNVTRNPNRHRYAPEGETFMQPIRHLILAGMTATLLAFGAPQASAQDPAAPDFSQQQIEAFADAAVEMQRLSTSLQEQAREAANQDEIARLQQQGQAQALQIVEDAGLSADEYTAIVQAANQDPDLYTTIVDLMEQRSTP